MALDMTATRRVRRADHFLAGIFAAGRDRNAIFTPVSGDEGLAGIEFLPNIVTKAMEAGRSGPHCLPNGQFKLAIQPNDSPNRSSRNNHNVCRT